MPASCTATSRARTSWSQAEAGPKSWTSGWRGGCPETDQRGDAIGPAVSAGDHGRGRTPAYMSPEVLRGEAARRRAATSGRSASCCTRWPSAGGRMTGARRSTSRPACLSESPGGHADGSGAASRGGDQALSREAAGRRYRQAGEVRAALEAMQPSTVDAPAGPTSGCPRCWPRQSPAGLALAAAWCSCSLFGVERLRDRLGTAGLGARDCVRGTRLAPRDRLRQPDRRSGFRSCR